LNAPLRFIRTAAFLFGNNGGFIGRVHHTSTGGRVQRGFIRYLVSATETRPGAGT